MLCIYCDESQVINTTNSGTAHGIALVVPLYLELVELYRLVVVDTGFLMADVCGYSSLEKLLQPVICTL